MDFLNFMNIIMISDFINRIGQNAQYSTCSLWVALALRAHFCGRLWVYLFKWRGETCFHGTAKADAGPEDYAKEPGL